MTVAFALSLLTSAAGAPDLPSEEGEELDLPDGTPVPPRATTSPAALPPVDDEDPGMVDYVAKARLEPPPPTWFHLDAAGRSPLHDDWDIQVVAFSSDKVLVTLPVLVALDRVSFEAAHPTGILLGAEIESAGEVITHEEIVSGASVHPHSPTWVFLQTAFPMTARSADLRFRVRWTDIVEGSPTKVADLRDRYARTTVFTRP